MWSTFTGRLAAWLLPGKLEPGTRPKADVWDPEALEVAGYAAVASHVGCWRENNEDAFLCDGSRQLFVVCDGLGGMAAGEIASREAIRALGEYLTPERLQAATVDGDPAPVCDVLKEALAYANQAVLEEMDADPAREGMATTVVAGHLQNGTLYFANLGDSRAYRLAAGELDLLSQDHSEAAEAVLQGLMTPEEAQHSVGRNRVTRFLGNREYREPATGCVPLAAGDRVLFCSDGLWDMVSDEEIAGIARCSADPGECVRRLVTEANRAGGHDNVTVIALFHDTAPSTS